MAVQLTEDLRLTHAYLNPLFAGFQGSYAASHVLEQLGGDAARDSTQDLREVLDWLGARLEELWQGRPVLRKAEDPPSELGAVLLRFFEVYKGRLLDFIALVMLSLHAIQDSADAESAKFVAASVARHAYTRQHFVQGLVRYGEVFGQEEVADRWRQHTLSCQAELREANALFARLKEGASMTDRFCVELWNTAATLPGIFKNQFVDLLSAEALRGIAVTFEGLGIPAEEADRWRALGMDAAAAGRWWAFDLTPEEAAAWIVAGFTWDTTYVGAWKVRNFDVPAAVAWHTAGFGPAEAYAYVREGAGSLDAALALRARRQADRQGSS